MSRSDVTVMLRSHHTPSPPHRARTAVVETGLRVLLVDAEIARLLPLADALRRAGLRASIATSADEAIFEVQASPPDVVVLAGDMVDAPMLSRLRAVTSTPPIVLMTTAPACRAVTEP
jgi:DNA-binding NtrC family response regulator